ncbi:MAG: zinc ABC transporter substrate-binding protein [Thermomicrobiales bacterium]
MNVGRWIRVVALAVMSLTLVGSGAARTRAQGSPVADDSPLNVAVSFSILADLVANVGGDAVSVSVLVPSGSDAHTFEPSPDDVAIIEGADLLFENGLGFESWLDDLYGASGSAAERVVVTDGLDLIEAGAGDEDHADEGEHADEDEGGHADGEHDPHVWHDVANAIAMTETIRDALSRVDPANASTYAANADAALASLTELDAFVVERVAGLDEDQRKLVTSHDTFGYFARRYGFEVIGTALGSMATESGDPSAQQIAGLVDAIDAAGVPAIFAENVSNPDLMRSIADEAGVELAPPLYTDALGEPGGDADTYDEIIRHNVTTIVTALGTE